MNHFCSVDVKELSDYLFLEHEPVPLSKVETVHPLPRGADAEYLTLKNFVRKQSEFQLITVKGEVRRFCVVMAMTPMQVCLRRDYIFHMFV